MYVAMPESNEVTFPTEERKGNKPTVVLPVEIEASSNAGHAVESASEMQLWAMAVGMVLLPASNAHIAVEGEMTANLRFLRCNVECVGVGGRSARTCICRVPDRSGLSPFSPALAAVSSFSLDQPSLQLSKLCGCIGRCPLLIIGSIRSFLLLERQATSS